MKFSFKSILIHFAATVFPWKWDLYTQPNPPWPSLLLWLRAFKGITLSQLYFNTKIVYLYEINKCNIVGIMRMATTVVMIYGNKPFHKPFIILNSFSIWNFIWFISLPPIFRVNQLANLIRIHPYNCDSRHDSYTCHPECFL